MLVLQNHPPGVDPIKIIEQLYAENEFYAALFFGTPLDIMLSHIPFLKPTPLSNYIPAIAAPHSPLPQQQPAAPQRPQVAEAPFHIGELRDALQVSGVKPLVSILHIWSASGPTYSSTAHT